MKKIIVLFLVATLAACSQNADAPKVAPKPQVINDASKGYYCTMNLNEHNGGKAQIFLESKADTPIWFSTINQAIGFTRHPGEPKDIAAIYVTDMAQVKDWNAPNADNAWIDAKTAYYVINSKFIGGMGTEDALPFSTQSAAEAFVKQHGGEIVAFDAVPDAFIYK